jgi:hypothetical protein
MTDFKFVGSTLRNGKEIHVEIKGRINSGHHCYYSVQNVCHPATVKSAEDQDMQNQNSASFCGSKT